MKSCVIKISEFFKMDAHRVQADFFLENKKQLLIPLYQREFKWKEEKVTSLITDIKKNAKYLGNIILDEKENHYEIVDGQQRITTCLLAMVAMYNYYFEHPREQSNIASFIQPYDGNVILKNDSIGAYLDSQNEKIELRILEENDVYQQSTIFIESYNNIKQLIDGFDSPEEVRDFKDKLFDCELLVLINNNHGHTRPVEQLFLDINEKSQQLEVEDVFKGHCFENYAENYHVILKSQWVDFKKTAMSFREFGFKDVSEYIYLYLLEMDNNSLPNNLTSKGRHYLEGKTMDQTEKIILGMIDYGKKNLQFNSNIKKTDYNFEDLCHDSARHINTPDITIMKTMFKDIFENPSSAIYQKLPVLSFIYLLCKNEQLPSRLSHNEFRKIVANLYIYTALFILSGQRKSKNQVDHKIRDAMRSENPIREVVIAARSLRKEKVVAFSLRQSDTGNKLKFIYSVIDNYNCTQNWITQIYSAENNHNDEHFIIPKSDKVKWIDGNIELEIISFDKNFMNKHRKKAINYLVIDKDLNESIGRKDIISKIDEIREWFQNRGLVLPHHIRIIFNFIETLPEYNELKNLKGTNPTIETIGAKYAAFWNAYYNEANSDRMLSKITTAFHETFVQATT